MAGSRTSLVGWALGLVVGFVATSVMVDRIIAGTRLPAVPGSLDGPHRQLAALEAAGGDYDVVYVGCSYSTFAIDPERVDAEAARLGVPIRSFNLSSGGTVALTSARVCERLLADGERPRAIYFELSPGILNSRPTSTHYGMRSVGGWREATIVWENMPQFRDEAALAVVFSSYRRWSDLRTLIANVRDGADWTKTKYRSTERGWIEWLGGVSEREATIQHQIAWRGYYWGDFRIDGFMLDAVRRTMQLADAAGVKIRFYEVPVSSHFQRVISEDIRRQYAEALATLEAEGMAAPWVAPDGLVSDDDFFDTDHMLGSGAEKFSRAIAVDVVRTLSSGAAD